MCLKTFTEFQSDLDNDPAARGAQTEEIRSFGTWYSLDQENSILVPLFCMQPVSPLNECS